jgi:hypothetical protein
MEDYEMKDRTSTVNKYRYKRTYNDLTPIYSDFVQRPEKRMKYSDVQETRMTFPINQMVSNTDVEMTVVTRPDNKKR